MKIRMTKERFDLAEELFSIATVSEWDKVIAGTYAYEGTTHCQSCRRWIRHDCEGCFIFERTNGRFCEGTPVIWFNQFDELLDTIANQHEYEPEYLIEYYELQFELKLAAQAQLDFLKRLYNQIVQERLREFVLENVQEPIPISLLDGDLN